MQFWGSSKINYSSKDVAEIVSQSLEKLKEQVNDDIYITQSKSGVVTATEAQREVDEALLRNGRTSIGLLSSKLDLDRNVIRYLVSQSKSEFYLNNSDTILCKPELVRIKSSIKAQLQSHQYWHCLDACTELNIDLQTLHWFTQQMVIDGLDLVVVNGEIVISKSLYGGFQSNLVSQLNDLKEPISLDSVQIQCPGSSSDTSSGSGIPDVVQKLVKNPDWIRNNEYIRGSLDAGLVFTPQSFTNRQASELLQSLKQNGYVKIEKDQEKWLKSGGGAGSDELLDVKFEGGYAITSQYLNKLVLEINNEVSERGYASVNFASGIEPLVISMIKAARPVYSKDKDGLEYFVSKSFADRLVKQCREWLMNNVEKDATRVFEASKKDFVNKKTTVDSLVNSNRKSERLKYHDLEVPQQVVVHCLSRNSNAKTIANDYNAAFSKQLHAVFGQYETDQASNILVYVEGLKFIEASDTRLFGKLTPELLVYAQNHLPMDPSELTSLSALESYLRREYTLTGDLTQQKQILVSHLEEQLGSDSNNNNAALVLHLAVLIAHSRLPGNRGILRASGKHVPKIIKQLAPFMASSTSKEEDRAHYEDFVRLKEAVLEADGPRQSELMARVKRFVK